MGVENLESITLSKGSHDSLDEGSCIMEVVSWLAGAPWTDRPWCASPVISAFLRSWNDALPDDTRQDLKQYIIPLLDSRGTPEQEWRRSWLACDWLVRTFTPRWLRLANLADHADALETLPEITSTELENWAGAVLEDARVTAEVVARFSRDTAWAAASDALGESAGYAAQYSARKKSGSAVWIVAASVARVAMLTAATTAGSGGETEALAPTVLELQESAHDLVRRMLATS